MKHLGIWALLAAFLLPVSALAIGLPWEKQLPFSDATIRYRISGMEEGEKILYIRDHGRQQAIYQKAVARTMGMQTDTVEFRDPEFIYNYDLVAGEGMRMVNPSKYMIEEYGRLSPEEKERVRENVDMMGATYAETVGGDVVQNAEKILGYNCDRVEIMGGSVTYLIHNTDIALKTEMNMMGMSMRIIATSVDKGSVDEAVFRHPPGILVEMDSQSDEMARDMARQAIALLKDPESARQPYIPPTDSAAEGDSAAEQTEQVTMTAEEKQILDDAQQMLQGLQQILGGEAARP